MGRSKTKRALKSEELKFAAKPLFYAKNKILEHTTPIKQKNYILF